MLRSIAMLAWLVDRFGEPEEMRLDESAPPEPAPGQVRVRVRAAGINFFDLLQLRGQYQSKPPFPFIPGAEIAGEREDTGERVFGFCGQGGYAERAVALEDRLYPIPRQFDYAQAAAFLVVYHTSWFGLTHRTKLESGDWLLVHAGASGTGMSAIQIGQALGAQVIATAGSQEKLAFCKELGAEHALDYRDSTWVDRVKEITGGHGADVIYDPVGGDVFDLSTKCIAAEGRLLVIGFAAGRIPTLAANRILLKNMSAVGVYWGGYVAAHPGYPAEAQSAMKALIDASKLTPIVKARYALDQGRRALRDVADRKVLGKAVLMMD